jgi:nanoRNase/pAp phosphatase (c-di-AMP/oligoRNAs hydrolase)
MTLMPGTPQDDPKIVQVARTNDEAARKEEPGMTSFVESCVETVAGSAVEVERRSRHRPRAHRLIRAVQDKKNILVTTHLHPDPDALASSYAMAKLLQAKLKGAKVTVSVKGNIGGGYNAAFVRESDMKLAPWDDKMLSSYDAIVLLDVQPTSKFSPLPPSIIPTAVVDHHRARGRRPSCPFCDIRTDVGATSSIVFSYCMELDVAITRDTAAMLLFAIETDLAGAAGQPGELDNMALSSLTLLADTRKLYRMRYAPLPQSTFQAYTNALTNAVYYDTALTTHLDMIESSEAPAVVADFLLRFSPIQWVLATAINNGFLVMSLRTSSSKGSAADVMRRLLRNLGEGGGHRTKAGGAVPLETGSAAEVDRIRTTLRQRLLRATGITNARAQRLVPREPDKKT